MESFSATDARNLAIQKSSSISKIFDDIRRVAELGLFKLTIDVPRDECYDIKSVLNEKGYDVEMNGDPDYIDPEFTINW